MRALVTGATGFLGSHLVDRLLESGHQVRGLARNPAKMDALREVGAEPVMGDITDFDSLKAAVRGVDTVFHAAAHVTDWGPWCEFEAVTVMGTENVLRAAAGAGVARFLHVSTASVYDDRVTRKRRIVTEDVPHNERGDRTFGHYARAKVLAERAVWRYHETGALTVSVVRPVWVYGPRDETIMLPLVKYLRSAGACWLGRGNPSVDPIYVTDVADCAITAATHERAIGQAYNVAPDREIGAREFLSALCRALDIPAPQWSIPYSVLATLTTIFEAWSHFTLSKKAPALTRAALTVFTADLHHDVAKAQRELGWSPKVSLEEGVHRTVAWVRQRGFINDRISRP